MLRIGLFRYNLIQTSVPLVYTNYFYNIEILSKHGRIQRGGEGTGGPPPPHTHTWNCQIICFCHVEIYVRPLLGIWTPPPWENFLDPRMPNTIFQNLFFKIITSLANIFSNLFSPREILGFFFYFNTGFHSIYVTTF